VCHTHANRASFWRSKELFFIFHKDPCFFVVQTFFAMPINPGFSVLKNARTGNVPGSYVGIFGTDAEKTWPIAFVNWNSQTNSLALPVLRLEKHFCKYIFGTPTYQFPCRILRLRNGCLQLLHAIFSYIF